MDRQEMGRRGEDAAAAYLERRGMAVVDRNWRCTSGEADIIALDGHDLVVVEVKTRSTDAKGTAEAAVTPAKQRRITRIAQAYLSFSGLERTGVRFDVITVRVLSPDRALLRHHMNAFDMDA